MVSLNLEGLLNGSEGSRQIYRSKSEEIVAEVLEGQGIRFSYEDRTYVEARDNETGRTKGKLIYPDFHLDDLGIVVEFAGRYKGESEQDYRERIESKKRLYEENGIRVAWISPEDVWDKGANYKRRRSDYKLNVLMKIYRTIREKGTGERKKIEVPAYQYAA